MGLSSDKKNSIVIHVDDFQSAIRDEKWDFVSQMYLTICDYISQYSFDDHIMLFLTFSGTAPVEIAQTINISKHTARIILLSHLTNEASLKLIWNALSKSLADLFLHKEKSDHRRILNQAIGDMGGIPRFLQYLLESLEASLPKSSVDQIVHGVLLEVLSSHYSHNNIILDHAAYSQHLRFVLMDEYSGWKTGN